MAWLKVEQSLPSHRKTLLGAQLACMDEHKFMGHVVHLWLWALDHADDEGCLPPIERPRIAEQAGVPKRQGAAFICSLVESGFLEDDGGYLVIHDWKRYAGKLNEKRAGNAKRQKNFRARNAL